MILFSESLLPGAQTDIDFFNLKVIKFPISIERHGHLIYNSGGLDPDINFGKILGCNKIFYKYH